METEKSNTVNMCKVTQRVDGTTVFRCLGSERCKFNPLVNGLKSVDRRCPYTVSATPVGCANLVAQNEAMFRQKQKELLRALCIVDGGI
jgi:hypothetical protein